MSFENRSWFSPVPKKARKARAATTLQQEAPLTSPKPRRSTDCYISEVMYAQKVLAREHRDPYPIRRVAQLGSPPRTPPTRPELVRSPPATRRLTSQFPFKYTRMEESLPNEKMRSQQRRAAVPLKSNIAKHLPMQTSANFIRCTSIGHPSLGIYKLSLPPSLMSHLDSIVAGCEHHASTLPMGWTTNLYTLTKQDVPLLEAPEVYRVAKPVSEYLQWAMRRVYHQKKPLRVDWNQPHVIKYDAKKGRRGVELHHDKCDFTANLCLSRSYTYVGGGTVFPDAKQVVRLEFGEFIVHPGRIVHGGAEISSGTRYLMVVFANATA